MKAPKATDVLKAYKTGMIEIKAPHYDIITLTDGKEYYRDSETGNLEKVPELIEMDYTTDND